MWWSDIEDIKSDNADMRESVKVLTTSILHIECIVRELGNNVERIQNSFDYIFKSEEENSCLNRINEILTILMDDERRQHKIVLAEKTLDKFEDYMKNVERLNTMVNEMKGCISMARAAIGDRKEQQKEKTAKKSRKYLKRR